MLCMMGGKQDLCSSNVYGKRQIIRAYLDNREKEHVFFVTVDVFINIYIRCGNMRSFLDVINNKYALVS